MLQIENLIPLTYGMLINTKEQFGLKNVVETFPITKNTGFVAKSYYSSNFCYTNPPKGPIPNNFKCVFCKHKNLEYHDINCEKPLDSSLILEKETPEYPGVKPGVGYERIVVKSGQKKVASKGSGTRSELVYDTVELRYRYPNDNECIIRVYKNGTINIISAPFEDDDLPYFVLEDLHATETLMKKYTISAQFNLYPRSLKESIKVNLNVLNTNLKLPYFKFKDNGMEYLTTNGLYYVVSKYVYNSGDNLSRSGKITNPYIQFVLIEDEIKINVIIYIRGAVQLKASFLDKKETGVLDLGVLTRAYTFLKSLIENVNLESNNTLLVTETLLKKPKIMNTVNNKQPEKCHNRKGTKPGEGDKRPVPYSFYGVCPIEGQYVPPRGTLRSDGKFEPCCKELKGMGKDSHKRYLNIILNGYPDKEAREYGETIPVYGDSAVYVPGTKTVESRSFPGLNNLPKQQLIGFLEEYGYINSFSTFTKQLNSKFKFRKLNKINFSKLTKDSYVLSPIWIDTISCILQFDSSGKTFFINRQNEVSETILGTFPEFAGTTVDCYLSLSQKSICYFTDILVYKNKDLTKKEFYSQETKDTRFFYLNELFNNIKTNAPVELNMDLNIVNGAQYYTSQLDITGLLFIPYSSPYYSPNVLTWSDTEYEYNNLISLNVTQLKGNRWIISLNGTFIENFPQGSSHDVEIPVAFVKKTGVKNGDIVLFKINLKQTGYTIENRKPLTPLEKIDTHINEMSDISNLIDSIINPIPISTFQNINVNPPGFIFGNTLYYQTEITKPLKSRTV